MEFDSEFENGKIFRISFSSKLRKFRITSFDNKYIDELIDVFSDVNPASFFMKQYGYAVESKISIINKFGYFPVGFVFELLKHIKLKYGSLSYVQMSKECLRFIDDFLRPLKNELNGNVFEISNISDDSGRNVERRNEGKNEYKFRDYQRIAIEKLIFKGYGRGIIELPTSSGKSYILSNFIYNVQKHINNDYKFLVLVPNKQLVSQMYNDFIDYGMKPDEITKFTAGLRKNEQYDPDAKIIIANRQYVFSNTDKLPRIDALFCDELHQCLSKATNEFINNLDCRIKVGCTGSIPRQKYNKWSLIGMMGNVLYSEEVTDLQKQGFISKLKITQINIKDMNVQNNRDYLFHLNPKRKYSPDDMGYSEIKFNEAHDAEHEYYAEHYKEIYTPVIRYLNDLEENTLVLFDRIEVGKRLTEVAKNICDKKKIHYIDGSVDVKDRITITNELENSGNNIIFAENAVFSTGINIKRLNHIVFMCSFKSFTRCIQSIGRILRLHSKKDYAHLIDVSCNYKYSRKHLNERLKIYQEVYHKKPDEIINITI